MIKMDLAYLSNISILLDVKIMLKTTVTIARQVFEWQQAAHRVRQNQNG
jgi:lipopolysaccharide/colanic/teichoic acid biosynthesis glycosyltransferase